MGLVLQRCWSGKKKSRRKLQLKHVTDRVHYSILVPSVQLKVIKLKIKYPDWDDTSCVLPSQSDNDVMRFASSVN